MVISDDVEERTTHNDLGRKQYDAAMNDSDYSSKGAHIYKSPYLLKENNVAIELDNPTENFVPTPTIYTGEGSKLKKAIKIALFVLIGAFVVYGVVSILTGGAEAWGLGEVAKRKLY